MATYIPGVQSYMPNWQPFTPDYKFLSDVLETKTNRYNTNYKALNDLYSKVVYSDLSRKDTQEMRNQYAENLGKQLELVSGMDLSVMQNADAAKALFKPFFEEDIIVKDMVFTKQFQKEMNYTNMLMNSPDKEQREMYWQQGVKALQYQMEDFKAADQSKALTMGLPRYVPDADLYEKAITFLKGSGLDVTQEYVDETGYFIVKDRNGNLITNQALQMAQKALMDDPMVQQAYYTDSYVRSRDFAQAGLEAGRFKSIDEGKAAWAKETISRVEKHMAARVSKEKAEVQDLRNVNLSWDDYLKSDGVIPGSDEEKDMNEVRSSLEAKLMGLQTSEEVLASASSGGDQNTEGLLNKAYNLLMGYNIQDDLVAASVAFSNMNKSRELKVNEYKKQQLQFQHDFAKMAAEYEYNVKLEGVKQKNRIELEEKKAELADPYGGILDQLFAESVTDKKAGTAAVAFDPQTGKAINVEKSDYVKVNSSKIEVVRQQLNEEQINLALDLLERTTPNKTGKYNIMGGGKVLLTGSLPELKKQLLDPSNAYKAETFYNLMNARISDGNQMKKLAPIFVTENGGATYQELAEKFRKTTAKKYQFDNMISTGNQVMLQNFNKAIQTGLVKEANQINKDVNGGAPKIFTANEKGAVKMMGEAEYVRQYVEKAKAKQIKQGDKPVGWSYVTPESHDRYTTGMIVGGLAPAPAALAQRSASRPSTARWEFNENAARIQAQKAYARQKDVVNSTLNGSLNTEAEKNGKVKSGQKMFQAWDPYSYMRGTDLKDMTPGDALVGQYYSVNIDPSRIGKSPDQYNMLKNLMTQVRGTTAQELSFIRGDVGSMEDADLKISDEKARKAYELYIQDVARFRNPKASKEGMPLATVSYAPQYGPGSQLSKDRAAYVINFDPNWLKKYAKGKDGEGIFDAKDLASLSSITVSFPQAKDQNDRRMGEYNFSAVRNKVTYSPNKQIQENIANGGSYKVFPDANNNYIMEIKPLQYDPTSGNFVDAGTQRFNLSQMMQERGETIGYIDQLVTDGITALNRTAKQNTIDQQNNKKIKGVKK
ncbi:MAG: hypothetical protein E6R13_00270 [Spirochaetes bacterium]|nr:MAG: hypothetical protein E6R13_00270 [Spirochaetota bacterium]